MTTMVAAGIPPCFWSYATPCWCMNYNTERIKGDSNWERLWKEPFHGTRFPFGCQVIYKPSDTRKLAEGMKHEKWDAKGRIGIFAGYKLHPGYGWKGEYLVWDRASFQHSDLRSVSTHLHQRVGKPYVTRQCVLPEAGISFPLKEHYEKVNADLFDPRITMEDYEPNEEARIARALPREVEEKSEEGQDALKHELEPIEVKLAQDRIEVPSKIETDTVHDTDPAAKQEKKSEGTIPSDHEPITVAQEPVSANSQDPAAEPDRLNVDDLAHQISSLPHHSVGHAADGRMYRDDDDNRVKLDRRGRVFRVGADGWRLTKASGRPSGVDPDIWASLRPILLKENKTYEEFKAEAEASNRISPPMAMAITEEDLVSPKFTLIEIFAGSARITTACRDVGLATGPPIDINTGYDLLTKRDQDEVWDIIKNGLPTVIFMAPVCTSWSSLSNVLPEAERLRRRAASYPLVEFCAELATHQQQEHRYFIIENPETSQMWKRSP